MATKGTGSSVLVKVLLGILAAAVVFVVGFGSGAAAMWLARPAQSALPSGAAGALTGSPSREARREQGELLWDVWEILDEEYIEPEAIDRNEMIYGAAAGMVATLGDSHTTFVEPAAAAIIDEDMQGSFEGIGATVDMVDGVVVIVRPIPGSPAERAGIKAGDRILAANEEPLAGLTLSQAITRIRGPRGSTVALLVQREGVDEPFIIEVTRDKIELETVEYRMLDDGVAYLRLTEFNAVSGDKVQAALKELLNQNPVGLIFDLRGNPGGYLHMAVQVAGEFLPRNTLILTEEQRDKPDQEFRVRGRGLATEIPLVVLVNGGSASASEIVAGAIQDQGRGSLVGETTYGKGSVQQTHTLRDGSSLRVTIARWLLPSGRNLDRDGIAPDVEVELTREDFEAQRDPQMDVARDILLGRMP
jgi:carboxyl-terminal processing protease